MKLLWNRNIVAALVIMLTLVSVSVVVAFTYTATVSTPYSINPSITASVVNAQSGNGPCTTSWSGSQATVSCGPVSVNTAGATFTVDISIQNAHGTSGSYQVSTDTDCGAGAGTSGTFTISSGLASLTCNVVTASNGGSSNVNLSFS